MANKIDISSLRSSIRNLADSENLTHGDVMDIRNLLDKVNKQNDTSVSDETSVQNDSVFKKINGKLTPVVQDESGAWVPKQETTKDELFDAKGNPIAMSADRKTLVPLSPASGRGTIVDNPGEIDNNAVKSIINQLDNILRPVARMAASTTPMGKVGTTVADIVSDIKNKQISDNPLSRFLSDTSKAVKRTIAGAGDLQPATPEGRALDYLNEKLPAAPYPQAKGLKRYAGVGTFKTPYGQFNIDESGTLRKL